MIKYHSKWTVHNRYKVLLNFLICPMTVQLKSTPKTGGKIPKLAFYAFRLAYWLINLKYSFFMLIKQCRNMHRRFLHTFSYVRNLSEAQFVPKPGVKMSKYHYFAVLCIFEDLKISNPGVNYLIFSIFIYLSTCDCYDKYPHLKMKENLIKVVIILMVILLMTTFYVSLHFGDENNVDNDVNIYLDFRYDLVVVGLYSKKALRRSVMKYVLTTLLPCKICWKDFFTRQTITALHISK